LEKLIDSEEETVEEPQENPGEVSRPVNPPREVSRSNIGLLRVVLLVLLAVVLVVLIVLFARWLYHATYHNSQTTQTGTGSTSQANTSLKKQSTNQTQASRPNPNAATTPANNPNLPNGGAGNVVAIFAGSTLAAAGLHYVINARRSNKSEL
jgi:uncharacterized protein HemX